MANSISNNELDANFLSVVNYAWNVLRAKFHFPYVHGKGNILV